MIYYTYATYNIVNYKVYIGVTHKPIESGYLGSGKLIKQAINKYGKEFFVRQDVFSGTLKEASYMEKYYINYYNATENKDHFYNLRHGGYDGPHGDITLLKISEKTKAAWKNEKIRNKYIEAFKTRDYSKVGNYDKNGKNNPMYGKKHTKESKLKMSKKLKGQKRELTIEEKKEKIKMIKNNPKMMGPKSDLQKARLRWSTLKRAFKKEPIIHEDIKMMHTYYNTYEALNNLSKEELLEFLKFRFKFLNEELEEGMDAIENKDPEEICDSLIDLIVVAIGTLDLFGIDFKKAWYEVLKANMNKEPGVKEGRKNPFGFPDLIKKDDWEAPSHEGNHGKLDEIF